MGTRRATIRPMSLLADRRRQRSDDPLVALHYQLANVRREAELEAIVVADDSGVVVAGAGRSHPPIGRIQNADAAFTLQAL